MKLTYGDATLPQRIPSGPPIEHRTEMPPVELMRRVATALATWTPPGHRTQIAGTASQNDFVCAALPHNRTRVAAIYAKSSM